jgi:TonB-dependent receptor
MQQYAQYLLAFLVSILLSTVPLIAQQQYTITGTVREADTRQSLPGAMVKIIGSNVGQVCDADGNFALRGVDMRSGQLEVSFIGYQSDTSSFDFGQKQAINLTIALLPAAQSMRTVEIRGRLEGQAKALAEQRVATNIKNVIDAEQMQKFPDLNAAQAISRVPGITLLRDQGEGRYVQLRGTPPELSNFSVNGEQIPSPEGGIRYVALDVVPVDQLSSIEISKALTPDLDGDAIGGSINLRTKTARDTIPEIRAALAGGYNNLSQNPQFNAQFAFGQRVKAFGFYVNASFLDDRRAAHNMEFDFNESRFGGDTSFRIHYDDIQIRHYDTRRQRTGLSGAWDWKPNKNHEIMLTLMYNRFDENELRRRVRYNIGNGFMTSETSSREAQILRDTRERRKIQTLSNLNLGGNHTFGLWKVEYLTSLSDAREQIPDRMDINFVNDLVNINIDLEEANFPRVWFPRARDSATVNNYNDYEFDEMLLQNTLTKDQNLTARLHLERLYGDEYNHGSIKIGGKIRFKNKDRDNQGRVYHKFFQVFAVNSPFDSIRQIYNSIAPELLLSTVGNDIGQNDILNRGYALGTVPDMEQSREFVDYYFQNFKLQESDTKEESLAEDFAAEERIYAAFGMWTHYWGKCMLLGGVRYEYTNIDYQGLDLRFQPFSDAFLGADTLRSRKNYGFVLPQFHFKYSPNEQSNLRAALTWTYSRPNFDDILPYRQSELDSREITLGNPDLQFARAINVDILAEKYTDRGGLLSGGVFYKHIDNFIYYFEQRKFVNNISRPGWFFVTTAQNGLQAHVLGAETSINRQFFNLPGILKHTGVYFNYTYTWSQATIGERNGQQEKITLPGQSPHTVNFALFYNSPKLYAKLSTNFNDRFLDELGIKKSWDIYYERNFNVDFNLVYHLNRNWQIYLNALNLNNQPLKYFIGTSTRTKQQEYYSWWGMLGLRLNI